MSDRPAERTLYLTITRGTESRPIVATSDPAVLRAVAEALYVALGGQDRIPVLRLQRKLDAIDEADDDDEPSLDSDSA